MADTENADTKQIAVTDKKPVVAKKPRPARVQVDPDTVKPEDRPAQTGTVFNIWYLKWSGGDREDSVYSQRKAEGRANIKRDSGYTKADKVAGSYFCLYFAKGLCINGRNCEYLHRLPTITDVFPPNVDCFGRDKFANYRDDMGGVGSFLRQNRTLYVGRIHVDDKMEETVSRHFAEWGEIDRIRVLNDRGVAFVTYANEANAQFAKEAMAHQSLDHDEVLNVRWATEDPNPAAKAREKRRIENQAADIIRSLLPASDPYKEAPKRRRLEGESAHQLEYPEVKAIEQPPGETIEDKKESPEPVREHIDNSTSETNQTKGNNGSSAQSEGLVSATSLAALSGLGTVTSAPTTSLVAYDSDDD